MPHCVCYKLSAVLIIVVLLAYSVNDSFYRILMDGSKFHVMILFSTHMYRSEHYYFMNFNLTLI